MQTHELPDEPIPVSVAAKCLGVPTRWLKDQLETGQLPGLNTGGRFLVHAPTLSRLLLERLKAEAGGFDA